MCTACQSASHSSTSPTIQTGRQLPPVIKTSKYGQHSLGYVKGILAGSSSPAHLLNGGITTNVSGVSPPSTQLQKIAGFSCAAHRRYRMGEPQNLCGMPDIVLVRGIKRNRLLERGGRWWELAIGTAHQIFNSVVGRPTY
jgi:hypothetical protein